jgi:hypothetical protein
MGVFFVHGSQPGLGLAGNAYPVGGIGNGAASSIHKPLPITAPTVYAYFSSAIILPCFAISCQS